jgi:signal transduction histidine kinase
MRDRIGAVGGELEVQSRPGGGTAVYGFVPAP